MKQLKTKVARRLVNTRSSSLMQYGRVIFGVGILIAIIAIFLPVVMQNMPNWATSVLAATLIVIGLIIGFLNITNAEAMKFMVAMIVVVALLQPFLSSIVQAFNLQSSQEMLKILGGVYLYISTLFVPAAIVVALKILFQTAKDEE